MLMLSKKEELKIKNAADEKTELAIKEVCEAFSESLEAFLFSAKEILKKDKDFNYNEESFASRIMDLPFIRIDIESISDADVKRLFSCSDEMIPLIVDEINGDLPEWSDQYHSKEDAEANGQYYD